MLPKPQNINILVEGNNVKITWDYPERTYIRSTTKLEVIHFILELTKPDLTTQNIYVPIKKETTIRNLLPGNYKIRIKARKIILPLHYTRPPTPPLDTYLSQSPEESEWSNYFTFNIQPQILEQQKKTTNTFLYILIGAGCLLAYYFFKKERK